jgi:hypothetical protein
VEEESVEEESVDDALHADLFDAQIEVLVELEDESDLTHMLSSSGMKISAKVNI